MRVDALGELAIISQLRGILDAPRADLLVGNGDDAAVWQPDGPVVATIDSVVAGIDWLVDRMPPAAIGHRAAAVNLSDLAAMGAQPKILLLALELPADQDVDDLLAAARGLRALADQHGAVVVGGDFGVSPGPARWTVTALGTLHGEPMCRDRVQPGDAVWLVGNVGQAALGLTALRLGTDQPALIAAHMWPQPLVQAGLQLQRLGVRAALDVSDGLGLDAQRLAQSSHVDLRLHLPRPAWLTTEVENWAAAQKLDWRLACAQGGDDYALLCAAPQGLDLTVLGGLRIGDAVPGTGQVELLVDHQRCAVQGFRHGN
jgi:thiamine-monophosphate kinase